MHVCNVTFLYSQNRALSFPVKDSLMVFWQLKAGWKSLNTLETMGRCENTYAY